KGRRRGHPHQTKNAIAGRSRLRREDSGACAGHRQGRRWRRGRLGADRCLESNPRPQRQGDPQDRQGGDRSRRVTRQRRAQRQELEAEGSRLPCDLAALGHVPILHARSGKVNRVTYGRDAICYRSCGVPRDPLARGKGMRRRDFLALLGGAAAVPSLAPRKARAQPSIPVVGVLSPASPEGYAERLRALRLGLKEGGYVEGENVAIETRWADNQLDRLPELASELVRRRVQVIVARGIPVAQAAKAATTTTSIVFVIGDDPGKNGLVPNPARPAGE